MRTNLVLDDSYRPYNSVYKRMQSEDIALTGFHAEVDKCKRNDERVEHSKDKQDMYDENMVREPI